MDYSEHPLRPFGADDTETHQEQQQLQQEEVHYQDGNQSEHDGLDTRRYINHDGSYHARVQVEEEEEEEGEDDDDDEEEEEEEGEEEEEKEGEDDSGDDDDADEEAGAELENSHELQQLQQLHQLQQLQQLQHLQQQQQLQPTKPSRPSRRSHKSPSSAYVAWARSQTTGASYILIAGGLLCLFFPDSNSGIYSIILGILVYLIETSSPSSRFNISSLHHGSGASGHHPSSNFSTLALIASPATVLRPHSIRAMFYLVAVTPCFLRAPNFAGGICLLSGAFTYATAALVDARKHAQKKKWSSSSRAGGSGVGASSGTGHGGSGGSRSRVGKIIHGFSGHAR